MSGSTPLARYFFKHITSKQFLCTPRSSCRLIYLPSLSLSFSSFVTLPCLLLPRSPVKVECRPLSVSVASSSSTHTPPSSEDTAPSGVPPCTSVLIRCRKNMADMLSETLLSFGASSVSMDDCEDYDSSSEISICAIFTDSADVGTSISRAANSVGMEEAPAFEVMKFNPYDWLKRTQESFHPMKVTDGLWIVPEWIAAPDPQATNIFINPGLAFGTGEHATTKLCLLLLHESVKGGESFLDYGTGSGILSIAALKLGAAHSTGVDIDPTAMTACHQNATLNNIGPDNLRLHLVPENASTSFSPEWTHPDMEESKFIVVEVYPDKNKYDIVIANILLNPLLNLAEEIISHAKSGALVGLSGILLEQVPQVIERYSRFLDGLSVTQMDDWACISGKKKTDIVH